MKAVIYNAATGLILRAVDCPAKLIAEQCQEGEDFYLNCTEDATHITADGPVCTAVVLTDEALLVPIRFKRNQLLDLADRVHCNAEVWDTLTQEQKAARSMYKQALRDFTLNCDVHNPVYPTAPF